jgi:hypothetical protein
MKRFKGVIRGWSLAMINPLVASSSILYIGEKVEELRRNKIDKERRSLSMTQSEKREVPLSPKY